MSPVTGERVTAGIGDSALPGGNVILNSTTMGAKRGRRGPVQGGWASAPKAAN